MTDLGHIREALAESYEPRAIEDQRCLICHGTGPFSLHLIEAAIPDVVDRLGPLVFQAKLRGRIRGGFAICTSCAPQCSKCRLPIRTSRVNAVFKEMSKDIPEGCSVHLGNGYCRHVNLFRRLAHKPSSRPFMNPFGMFLLQKVSGDLFGASFSFGHRQPAPSGVPAPKKRPYRAGDKVAGRYLVERVIQGGMGTVYVVRNGDERRILKTYSDSEGQRCLFEQEAQSWIAVGAHENIVQAFWIDELAGTLYIGAEYVSPDSIGRANLSDHIKAGEISLAQVIRWCCEFCYGMEHAISRGMKVHRDIKPANLMVSLDGTLKITDFGIAISRDVAAGIESSAGTLPYMPPEQWRGVTDGFATDCYAFGVVLHQLVFDKLPYDVVDPGILRVEYEALKDLPEHPLSKIILRALEPESSRRFQAPRELLEAILDTALRLGIPVPPRPAPANAERAELLAIASLQHSGASDKAREAALELTSRYPDFAPGWTQLGRLYLEVGKISKCVEATQTALRLDPSRSAPWNNLGLSFARLGLDERAEKAFRMAIKQDAANAGAMTNLAKLYSSQDRFELAEKWARAAVKLARDNWVYWVNLASVLRMSRKEGEAKAAYEQAVILAPLDEQARIRSII